LIGLKMPNLFGRMGKTVSLTRDDAGNVVSIESHTDGTSVEYEMRTSPINDRGGLVQGKVVLLRDVTDQRHMERELRALSSIDHLTGLMNRRTFFLELTKHIRLAHRYRYQLTVCMMDLDRFKELNDRYGHQVGDEALALAAAAIQKTIRSSDIAARYGGDELVLLLIHTGEKGALSLCSRVVNAVGAVRVQNGFQLGVSIGLTCMEKGDTDNGESLIARADKALYEAKGQGRGGIVVG
jgi:diguanylate cyclase (GGDEF)-like protein